MVITLSGDNDYLIVSALNKLKLQYLEQGGSSSIVNFDDENFEVNNLVEALATQDLFASNKLVIAKNILSSKDFSDSIDKIIQLAENSNLIIVQPKIDKRLSVYKTLKTKTEFREFNKLDERNLADWLIAYAQKEGGKLNRSNADYLISRVGFNQFNLANETDKLLLYSPEVTKETIDKLTSASPRFDIFQLLSACFNGMSKKAESIYANLRSENIEQPFIMSMFVWQLRNIMFIKLSGGKPLNLVASESSQNPLSLRNAQQAADGLSYQKLKLAINDLEQIDYSSKTSQIDFDQAISLFILKLTSEL